MDDDCGEWVESMGVASGCGCKEVYRFPHIYYLSLLLLYLFFFTAASLLFVHLKKNIVYTIYLLVHNAYKSRLFRTEI